ncbi:MAG: hypothetical protein ACLRIS_07885 [Flavonifractor plautii]
MKKRIIGATLITVVRPAHIPGGCAPVPQPGDGRRATPFRSCWC